MVINVLGKTDAATTSNLKIQTEVSSVKPVIIYQITRRHIPEESSTFEDLKYHTV